MTDRPNPWAGEGEPADAPTETLAEGLERINGEPIRPFDDEELAMIAKIGTWIGNAAVARGFPWPDDVLRAVIMAAGNTFLYNVALDAQEAAKRSAELDGEGDDEVIALPGPTTH